MESNRTLPDLLETSSRAFPGTVAVREPGAGEITYGELSELAGEARDFLARAGVVRGDRVGLMLPKSIDTVAAIFGALEAVGSTGT